MLNSSRCLSLLLVFAAVGCTDGVEPLPVEASIQTAEQQESVLAKSSQCQSVHFRIVGAPTGPVSFSAEISGDLEGTVNIIFDASSFTFAGVTFRNSGTAQWEVTGGIITGLESFETTFSNLNILHDRPGSPETLFENKGKHRAEEGVQKAELTYKGDFTLVPSPEIDHDYRGVICS